MDKQKIQAIFNLVLPEKDMSYDDDMYSNGFNDCREKMKERIETFLSTFI